MKPARSAGLTVMLMGGVPMAAYAQVPQGPSPIPDPIADVLRVFFNLPQWFQIIGAILGAVVAVVVLVVLWRRRHGIWGWFQARPRPVLAALVIAAVLAVAGFAWFGAESWGYMQHENAFCTSCHLMDSPIQRFVESGHRDLNCHDCHRQSIFASARQLYLWVAERPEDIGEHAPVPNRICSGCHIEQESEDWPQVAATAGHQVHFESDEEDLRGLLCVECHGATVHEFVPTAQTCGQSGCHESIDIELGAMAGETQLHCLMCHSFLTEDAAEDPSLFRPPIDELTPTRTECLACHEMEEILADLDVENDPHEGVCGWCHNPHEDETPQAASQSCTASGCHEQPRELTGFHRGRHERVIDDCAQCHSAHEFRVIGEDCVYCHTGERAPDRLIGSAPAGGTQPTGPGAAAGHPPLVPPASHPALVPRAGMAGAAAAGPVSADAGTRPPVPLGGLLPSVLRHGRGPSAADAGSAGPSSRARRLLRQRGATRVTDPVEPGPAPQDTFSHRIHERFDCSSCHVVGGDAHGDLRFRIPQGCFECHHSDRYEDRCTTCHQSEELGYRRSVATTVNMSVWETPRTRELPFEHAPHLSLDCESCHARTIERQVHARCVDCHVEHHPADATTECTTCHEPGGEPAHGRSAHFGCAVCHIDAEVAAMPPARNLCVSCHTDYTDHFPGGDCAECHAIRWLDHPYREIAP